MIAWLFELCLPVLTVMFTVTAVQNVVIDEETDQNESRVIVLQAGGEALNASGEAAPCKLIATTTGARVEVGAVDEGEHPCVSTVVIATEGEDGEPITIRSGGTGNAYAYVAGDDGPHFVTVGLSADDSKLVKTFLTYTASDEGQQALTSLGYAPLPASLVTKVRTAVEAIS